MLFGIPITTILGIVSSILGLVKYLVSKAQSRDDNEAGQLKVASDILSKAIQDIDKARGIENNLSKSVGIDPSVVRQPDEFTKP